MRYFKIGGERGDRIAWFRKGTEVVGWKQDPPVRGDVLIEVGGNTIYTILEVRHVGGIQFYAKVGKQIKIKEGKYDTYIS